MQLFINFYFNIQSIFQVLFPLTRLQTILTQEKENSIDFTLPTNRISLIQYITSSCPECTQMQPHFDEITERLHDENYDINLKTINCSKYNCTPKNISVFPTFALYESSKEAHRLTGLVTYKQLSDFLLENTSIDHETLVNIKKNEGVRILYERDFYNVLDGPFLILFYKRVSDFMREVFVQLASEYSGKLHLAEISEKNARNIVKKHNINEFPSIVGINDGLEVVYTGGRNYTDVNEFASSLIRPTFMEITWNELKDKNTEKPIFIVLYKDISVANHYFKQKAHDYKMSTEIFRSKDSELLHRTGNSSTDLNKDEVILTVYKNGSFHKYPYDINEEYNEGEIIKWIFHSHFPHLTILTDTNYINILHGIKPIIILLSPSSQNIEMFEEVAKTVNQGVPFTHYLFTYLDTFKFDDFLPTILPEIKTPSIVVYNPETKLFYTQKVDFTNADRLFLDIIKLIENYSKNKLQPIPDSNKNNKNRRLKYYLIIAIVTLVCGTIGIYKYREAKIDELLKHQI
ncbi:Thioredoxin domain-containing protein 5 like protein [Cucumispora dikerogammari]|nr:Thioredoxin domain-containing protein 5 like protein [Cucumispora dikerogammari]